MMLKDKLINFLEKYIYLSGIKKTPKEFLREATYNLLALAAASCILAVVIALLTLNVVPSPVPPETLQYFAYLAPLPLIVGIFLFFEPYFRALEHMRGAERELPYVSALMTTYAANGIMPHVALERIRTRHRDLFVHFSKLAERIMLIRSLFVTDEIEAMEVEGRRVVSPVLTDLLLSCASVERRGGDIYVILREKMRSIFHGLRENYKSLANRLSFIGDVLLVFYGVMPLMMYTMFALFASEQLAYQAIFYSLIVNPLLGVALVYLIESMVPKTPVKYTEYYYQLLRWMPLSVVVFLAFFAAQLQGIIKPKEGVLSGFPWTGVALAASAIAVSVPVAVRYVSRNMYLTSIDYALPSFVRDVAEEVKKGSTPSLAVVTLAKIRSYGSSLDRIVKKIATAIEAGRTFEESCRLVMDEVSWYCRMSLTLMVEADLMGAKPEVFDEVAEVTREIIDSIKVARASVAPLKFFGLITAALVIGITAMLVRQVLEPVANMSQTLYAAAASLPSLAGGLGVQLVTPELLPSLVNIVMAGSVVNTILMGLMTGKMTDGTLAGGFLYVIINSIISIGMIVFFFLLL